MAGAALLAPQWDYCLEDEIQATREAPRFTRGECCAPQAAWWATHQNDHHHMEHSVTLLTTTHKFHPHFSDNMELTKVCKELVDLGRSIQKQGKGTLRAIHAPQHTFARDSVYSARSWSHLLSFVPDSVQTCAGISKLIVSNREIVSVSCMRWMQHGQHSIRRLRTFGSVDLTHCRTTHSLPAHHWSSFAFSCTTHHVVFVALPFSSVFCLLRDKNLDGSSPFLGAL